MRKDDAFVLFSTYPICRWSGTLGPKLREGDRQTPEGFYTITSRQLHLAGRWPRSLNLGFPNVLDRVQARHGSYILVHGGCSSTGCFAMTNPVSHEIYRLTEAALRAGQAHVPVHVFPFRMTEENLAAHQESDWQPFWRNLKEGYDSFETSRRPRVSAYAKASTTSRTLPPVRWARSTL
jgi:murein L,D-transpeptidase YafK